MALDIITSNGDSWRVLRTTLNRAAKLNAALDIFTHLNMPREREAVQVELNTL